VGHFSTSVWIFQMMCSGAWMRMFHGRALQHDAALGVLVGVGGVQHVARLDGEPADLRRALRAAGHDADPRRLRVVPAVGDAGVLGGIEGDGALDEDHVVAGDGEVVLEGGGRPRHLDAVGDLPLGVGHVIHEVGRERRGAEEVQLAGDRVGLRVRGHRAAQLAVEVVGADRVEVPGELEGEVRLAQRQQASGVLDDVGAGGAGRQVRAVLGHVGGAVQGGGAHPAVAVPLGAAVAQPDAVDHAAALEPVGGGDAGLGVVAVTDQPAGQLRRQGALDGQLGGGDLVDGRGVVADQVGLVGGHGRNLALRDGSDERCRRRDG